MAGMVTLIGSGELAPGGARLHRSAFAGLQAPRVVFLDTPAGFETNPRLSPTMPVSVNRLSNVL